MARKREQLTPEDLIAVSENGVKRFVPIESTLDGFQSLPY